LALLSRHASRPRFPPPWAVEEHNDMSDTDNGKPTEAADQGSISKLDIAEHHLITSIELIAIEASPISTHVIVMACEEILRKLMDAEGVLSDFDYKLYIVDEHHTDFLRLIRRSYNFFKHADSDAEEKYDGPPLPDLATVNEIRTVMNAVGYRDLGGKNLPLVVQFTITMMAKHPHLFKKDVISRNPPLANAISELEKSADIALPALRRFVLSKFR
jgi:hypothetical protein